MKFKVQYPIILFVFAMILINCSGGNGSNNINAEEPVSNSNSSGVIQDISDYITLPDPIFIINPGDPTPPTDPNPPAIVDTGVFTAPQPTHSNLPKPTILGADSNRFIQGDDHVATIYWNDKGFVGHDNPQYDSDKQAGVYGYYLEWGEEGQGFPYKEPTPYHSAIIEPLEAGKTYEVRISAMDAFGNLSDPSDVVYVTHDPSRVDDRRQRMDGFFDDFNLPEGAFDELLWNQAYSGCADGTMVGQHINDQLHAHNMIKTTHCDRGVANSRARKVFNFTDRAGVIEFDLDGSKGARQLWYLDLIPAEGTLSGNEYYTRKRDITGHVALEGSSTANIADPPHMLRIIQGGTDVSIQYVRADGAILTLDNLYLNGTLCGSDLRYCKDAEGNATNLQPVNNVRHSWRIEVSKSNIAISIEGIKVVDVDLTTQPVIATGGLPYEKAHVVWLFFSYNTPKENIAGAMVHWDNFGWDEVENPETLLVVHNYTDGITGAGEYDTNNCCGPTANIDDPVVTTIPVPDDFANAAKAELMFTIQGVYNWTVDDHILINGNRYNFTQPTSAVATLPDDKIVGPLIPYSAVIEVDKNDLDSSNEIAFHLNNVGIFNTHLEFSYNAPIDAPAYTQPFAIFGQNYHAEIMPDFGEIGPNIVFDAINDIPSWEFNSVSNEAGETDYYTIPEVFSGTVTIDTSGSSKAQLVASGHAKGIHYYELLIDNQVQLTVPVNSVAPVASFQHKGIALDTSQLCNGGHELFIRGYSPDGDRSFYDGFLAHAEVGEYIPVKITTHNNSQSACP